jgi:hypothetical protein
VVGERIGRWTSSFDAVEAPDRDPLK